MRPESVAAATTGSSPTNGEADPKGMAKFTKPDIGFPAAFLRVRNGAEVLYQPVLQDGASEGWGGSIPLASASRPHRREQGGAGRSSATPSVGRNLSAGPLEGPMPHIKEPSVTSEGFPRTGDSRIPDQRPGMVTIREPSAVVKRAKRARRSACKVVEAPAAREVVPS